MRRMRYPLLQLALVGAALALIASSARADLVWAPSVPDITAVSLGTVTFSTTGGSMACNVTLSGFMNDFPLTGGASIGAITGGSVTGCTPGMSLRTEFTRPDLWLSTYNAFTGSLPYPTSVQSTVRSAQVLVSLPGGTNCLYIADLRASAAFRGSNPNTLGLLTLTGANIAPTTTLSGICPTRASLTGSFRVTPAATLTSLAALPLTPTDHHLVGINATQLYRFVNTTGATVEIVSILLVDDFGQGIATDPDPVAGLPISVGAGVTYNFTLRYVPLPGSTSDDKVHSTVVVTTRDAGGNLLRYKVKVYGDP